MQGATPKVALFCFGFTTNSPPDVARMQSVLRLYPERIVECVPVAQSTPPTRDFPTVVQGNFAAQRFFRYGSDLHRALASCTARGLLAWAVLDYFWLQANVYTAQYGGAWVSGSANSTPPSKTARLLDLGCDAVYLPVDRGRLNQHASYLQEFLSSAPGLQPLGVAWECVPATAVPLYVASSTAEVQEVLDRHHRGSNETQACAYLHADAAQRRFVRFRKTSSEHSNGLNKKLTRTDWGY